MPGEFKCGIRIYGQIDTFWQILETLGVAQTKHCPHQQTLFQQWSMVVVATCNGDDYGHRIWLQNTGRHLKKLKLTLEQDKSCWTKPEQPEVNLSGRMDLTRSDLTGMYMCHNPYKLIDF